MIVNTKNKLYLRVFIFADVYIYNCLHFIKLYKNDLKNILSYSALKDFLSSNKNLECLVLQNIVFREEDINNIARVRFVYQNVLSK